VYLKPRDWAAELEYAKPDEASYSWGWHRFFRAPPPGRCAHPGLGVNRRERKPISTAALDRATKTAARQTPAPHWRSRSQRKPSSRPPSMDFVRLLEQLFARLHVQHAFLTCSRTLKRRLPIGISALKKVASVAAPAAGRSPAIPTPRCLPRSSRD